MLSKFFLDRPVFAWVIAIILMALGVLMIYRMPVAQYPPIAPPSIAVEAYYTGASAETVENTVTQIIEQKMTGLDNLLYLSGTSSSSGSARVELTFAPGTDPDLAWSKVQNKLQLAMASLPDAVQRAGIEVSKSTRNYLIIVGLISEDGSMDGQDLRDYAQSNLEKILSRVPGVGEVESFGSQYSMRVWVNPERLNSYSLTMEDVIAALDSYNVEVSAGQLGGRPAVEGQRLNASIVVQHLLQTPGEFAAIPIRINQDGSVVRIRDVARTELGAERYGVVATFNGHPAAGMAIRQAAGANALATADAVKAKLEEMSAYFPPGMKVIYPYDTTPFTVVAIDEVLKTLIEAVVLVFLIMYLFMGSIRATLIPTIAVPVVLLGTFAVLGLFGFSINMLTMFATVLAIGLLVDDAIVVVENVERIMAEEGLPPREATAKSMDEITSALVGIGLVLSAVFGPMAFFGGSTGVLYRQFSVTIISSMLLSVVVALILTPVLCATLLKPIPKGQDTPPNRFSPLRIFFGWFNRNFRRVRTLYVGIVHHSFAWKAPYLLLYALLLGLVGFLFLRMPTAYIPDEDQGILLVQAILPAGSTLEQTIKVMDRMGRYFEENEQEALESYMAVPGVSFGGQGQNRGFGFVKLKDWDLRQRADLSVEAVAGRAMAEFSQIKEAMAFAFPPPPVIELGTATGFDFQHLDRGGLGHDQLMAARNQLLGLAAQDPRLTKVRPNGVEDTPEYHLDVDWDKAGALGVSISSLHSILGAAVGGAYVNDFIQAGRVKKVYVQADAPYRMLPEDLEKLFLRNNEGRMVPLSALATSRWATGSPQLERYNAFPSINIQGEAAPGYSTGEAMDAMEELCAKLPQGLGFDWTGLSYQERMATQQGPLLYAFSLFVIFLCVAALYESWVIPIVNMLMLPLGVLGAVVVTSLRGMPNDVYFQIGFLATLGLSTKNAILIIQFIKERMRHGERLDEATLGAVKTRFRPVIMTSLAFFFGVLPLAISTGAGAGAMNAIGTAVCGGMLSATFIDLIFIPLFFVLVFRLFHKGARPSRVPGTGPGSPGA
ncbi:MAG: efflux RND transporter permease subunit [Desulfovibrionaceae bacterium]